MDIKTFIPLISTVVGGLLAVAGGFFASYLIQKFTKAYEMKQLIRQKLEEAYLLTIELEKWLQSQMSDMVFLSENKTEKINNPANHLIMLAKCYGDLKTVKIADKLNAALEKFRKASLNFFKEAHTTGTKPSEKTFSAVGKPFEMSRQLTSELRGNIENIIRSNTLKK